ncbi:MAG: right-handed parallel beta-helix repeat-containing protein [Lentisphaerae bacterium]|nr:right-handed parallel beta-helix repeat-containing protein [Lentisphaerota bacterium]
MKKLILSAAVLAAVSAFSVEYPYAYPGFGSAAIYTAAGKDGAPLEFRKAGDAEWIPAQRLVLSPDKKELRGSIFRLREGTKYEYRITRDGKMETGSFTTKSSDVPIAKTIVLTNENFQGYLKLAESGTEKGYIRYTAKPGTVLKADFKHQEAILANKIRYVILDGLTIRGGGHYVIHLKDCENFRIVNCDLGDYGTARVPFEFPPDKTDTEHAKGLLYVNGKYVENEGAITVRGGRDILIERNFVHDPRCHANSWFYHHPWGPSGINYRGARGLTIRWNNIIGSDHHRWNDVIQGNPNIDAEICGNYLAFCNDDTIELDGLQQNIRFSDNLMEGSFCGVSIAPCKEGPSYIINNLRINPGDEFDSAFAGIKNNSSAYYTGRIHIFGNTFTGSVSVSGYKAKITPEQAMELKSVVKNNLFINSRPFAGAFWAAGADVDHNIYSFCRKGMMANYPKGQGKHDKEGKFPLSGGWKLETPVKGEKLANLGDRIGASGNLPVRPLALETSALSVKLSSAVLTGKIQLKSTGYSGGFRIVRPEFSPFFSVIPAEGMIKPGETVELTVTALPERAPEARKNCGAFLIRTPDGLARPVSVYFDNRDDLKKVAAMRKNVVYGQVVKRGKTNYTLKFSGVPQGEYYLAVRMTRIPWKIFHARQSGKMIHSKLKPDGSAERKGWAVIPWTSHKFFNFPRRAAGDLTVDIQVEKAASQILGCALVKTPEELLCAPETVLPNEKAMKVISKE